MKQTAVEWLYHLSKKRELDIFDLEQAKKLELAQRIDDYNSGHTDRNKNIFRLPTKNQAPKTICLTFTA